MFCSARLLDFGIGIFEPRSRDTIRSGEKTRSKSFWGNEKLSDIKKMDKTANDVIYMVSVFKKEVTGRKMEEWGGIDGTYISDT